MTLFDIRFIACSVCTVDLAFQVRNVMQRKEIILYYYIILNLSIAIADISKYRWGDLINYLAVLFVSLEKNTIFLRYMKKNIIHHNDL